MASLFVWKTMWYLRVVPNASEVRSMATRKYASAQPLGASAPSVTCETPPESERYGLLESQVKRALMAVYDVAPVLHTLAPTGNVEGPEVAAWLLSSPMMSHVSGVTVRVFDTNVTFT